MNKKIIVLLILSATLASTVFASTLITALPFGKGSWSFAVSDSQVTNFNNVTNAKQAKYGLSVGYGITNNTDVILLYNTANTTDFSVAGGALAADNNTVNYGLILKFAVMDELSSKVPFSLSIAAGTAPFSSKTTPSGMAASTMNGNQFGAGLIISKLIIPFAPYAAYTYMMQGGDAGKGLETDLSLGSMIGLSNNAAIFVEYTNKGFTPDGGTLFNQGEVAVEASYQI